MEERLCLCLLRAERGSAGFSAYPRKASYEHKIFDRYKECGCPPLPVRYARIEPI